MAKKVVKALAVRMSRLEWAAVVTAIAQVRKARTHPVNFPTRDCKAQLRCVERRMWRMVNASEVAA
jgi:hypothetical protein